MAHIPLNLGAGGGSGSDDCTATLDYVVEGYTAITKDSDDEPGAGRMKVNSLLSFSVAAYSGKRVLAIWKNPKAAKGRPYSGVYIRYSTSGSPGKTGGTQIYKGAGSNTAAEGQSQVYIDLPAANTKYYLSIYPYVTTSLGDITGAELNAEVTTEGTLNKTFASSQSFTIPEGYTKAKCFAVGGGAGGGKLSGGGGSVNYYAGGGGGGYAGTSSEFAVSAGQILAIIVGAGGAVGTAGGTSGIADIFTKAGGNPPSSATTTLPGGGSGGSGGGAAGYSGSGSNGGNGGSNGGNGTTVYAGGGSGQGSTTKAWGNGTLYAGGGGGSGIGIIENGTSYGGSGGSGGGGNGGHRDGTSQSATSGGANTGGGGGGGRNSNYGKTCFSAAGGSGIVLLQLY